MEEKDYTVEGRQFFSERDYARAKRDKKLIDELRQETDFTNRGELELLKKGLQEGRYRFLTILGRDFLEEVEETLKKAVPVRSDKRERNPRHRERIKEKRRPPEKSRTERHPEKRPAENSLKQERRSSNTADSQGREPEKSRSEEGELDALIAEELKKRDRRRRLIIVLCSAAAICSLGYFGLYSYYNYRTERNYQALLALKERPVMPVATGAPTESPPQYTLDEAPEEKEVLDEYKNLLIKNKKLIGWLKIDDTNIDCPVMQTTDNEYYLDHNTEQEYDKNGSIFMDKDCDVKKPSTNFILYGHHMLNGKMFGKLYLYQEEAYYKEHPYINFDTIYEKGTYQVMYVFRSKVYTEAEIVFKYYQFIDANSEQEFDSNMQEMAALSLYDTGVTARYGDQLLTLSTCDYQESDGRFVVVAKKIAKE